MSRKTFSKSLQKRLNRPKSRLPVIEAVRLLFVVGDVHGQYDYLTESLMKIPPKSAVIFLGDYCAYDGSLLLEFCKFLTEYDLQCFLLRGNHDHPFFWQHAHMRKKLYKHTGVELLSEVAALTWKNKRILTVNGAVSVDRSCVRYDEGRCWPSREGVQEGADVTTQSLVESFGEFDIMLSHSGYCDAVPIESPFTRSFASTDDTLFDDLRKERELLLKTLIASKVKLWVYGHFHRTHNSDFCGTELHCLDICRVGELMVGEDGVVTLHRL